MHEPFLKIQPRSKASLWVGLVVTIQLAENEFRKNKANRNEGDATGGSLHGSLARRLLAIRLHVVHCFRNNLADAGKCAFRRSSEPR